MRYFRIIDEVDGEVIYAASGSDKDTATVVARLFEVPSDMVSEINKEEYDLRPEYTFSGTLKQRLDDTSFDDEEKEYDDEYD